MCRKVLKTWQTVVRILTGTIKLAQFMFDGQILGNTDTLLHQKSRMSECLKWKTLFKLVSHIFLSGRNLKLLCWHIFMQAPSLPLLDSWNTTDFPSSTPSRLWNKSTVLQSTCFHQLWNLMIICWLQHLKPSPTWGINNIFHSFVRSSRTTHI